ncbi:hypothetical protein [Qingrenia yutianensis]|uniref:Uncharacterized protein n=1 Tax=Qingrenia yutianensis TaxID=2763676 RepID=A0A926ITP9_9FIRM|nr:hypothetical protein [Qingrenia yutianensis]MBC8596820.1 hypothetical protein [Qingrenia yutianensis]
MKSSERDLVWTNNVLFFKTNKDASFVLSDIESTLENTAHDYIIKRFLKK